MKYKIIKNIHTYKLNRVNFSIYERFLWKWIPSDKFSDFETYDEAEKAIFKKFNNNGIVEVDNNTYSFSPTTFPLP